MRSSADEALYFLVAKDVKKVVVASAPSSPEGVVAKHGSLSTFVSREAARQLVARGAIDARESTRDDAERDSSPPIAIARVG